MSVIRHQSLAVFADYHQFYVQDGDINPLAPEDWTDEDVARRGKVADNVVVICPLRNMTVRVEIVLHSTEPTQPEVECDHSFECSLELPTGHLQVHECTGGPVLDWRVAPGTYELRASFLGLASIAEDGLQGNDLYKIELWKGRQKLLKVTRVWGPPSEA